ncbi:sulfotransferase [Mycobacterium sp.]|uniref:sulfotransferase family protein n=1 Tax=Mycobacterium sp. TaxID=1785 RepID=UPI0012157301|nr:sulfotransferase [Mycobacterium sp.]TAM68263.1 MAG: sulfotransferase [Mycobacterium sp.]
MTTLKTTTLDADAVIAEAVARSGLRDFGPDDFIEPLRRFTWACHDDAHISAEGAAAIAETLIGKLISRLRFEDDLKRHPEILDEPLVSPLFLIGAGRVGSTKMHRLLANAAGIQSLPFWQLQNPAPSRDGTDQRQAACESFCTQIEHGLPQLFAAIEPVADEPDEEVHLFDLTMRQFYFSALAYTPSYFDWVHAQDWQSPYEYLKKLLQYLQWQNGTAGRPVLLKGPFHTPYIDIIARVFPDAKFVQIHRDPVTCAASLGKVAWMLQGIAHGTATKHEYGRLLEDYLVRSLVGNLAPREQLASDQITDFYYEDVVADAPALAEKIFQFWGQPLTDADRAAIRDWEATNRQHKYGRFEYSLEEMGVNRVRMETELAPYLQRFYPPTPPAPCSEETMK